LLFCVAAYGLLLPWLGFYWDDWPTIWYLHFWGADIFKDVFASDRPLLGVLFRITSPLVGETPAAWQVFGILTRWLSGLAFWSLLRAIWPRHPQPAAWTALLFCLYPGFSQQFISVTYSQVFIVLAVFLFSLTSMVWSVRRPERFWLCMMVSLACSGLVLFTVEYFFGLELLRPLILWFVLREKIPEAGKRLKRILVVWAPYLLLLAAFFVWRVFLSDTPRGEVRLIPRLLSDPVNALSGLLQSMGQDIFSSSVLAWGQTLQFGLLANFGLSSIVVYAAIVLASVIAAALLLSAYTKGLTGDEAANTASAGSASQPYAHQNWAKDAILLGIAGLLVGGWPFWGAGYPIGLDFPWDRFTLAMMFGASLLLAGVIGLLVRQPVPRLLVLSVLVGLAVGLQFQHANTYRREWNTQRNFFWQWSWRAPAIQPGTTILTSELPFVHYTDNSLAAPFHWLYAPEHTARAMDYMFYNIDARLGLTLAGLEAGLPIEQVYRATAFTGTTSQVLVVTYQPPGCLVVYDPARHARVPQKPKYIGDVMDISDPGLILAEAARPAVPVEAYFGSEPTPNWCYYYEKAELALQNRDWAQVADLGDRAVESGTQLYEVNAPELLPYIEGYAHTGQWEKSRQLTLEAERLTFRMQRSLCDAWERILDATPDSEARRSAHEAVQSRLQCTGP
ncbi:MAG TPA: hypothetical protein VN363_03550, partial [Anaerolineales bacterium]|nr:hypothetical protein [Anaerolineales bacterium]